MFQQNMDMLILYTVLCCNFMFFEFKFYFNAITLFMF